MAVATVLTSRLAVVARRARSPHGNLGAVVVNEYVVLT